MRCSVASEQRGVRAKGARNISTASAPAMGRAASLLALAGCLMAGVAAAHASSAPFALLAVAKVGWWLLPMPGWRRPMLTAFCHCLLSRMIFWAPTRRGRRCMARRRCGARGSGGSSSTIAQPPAHPTSHTRRRPRAWRPSAPTWRSSTITMPSTAPRTRCAAVVLHRAPSSSSANHLNPHAHAAAAAAPSCLLVLLNTSWT